MKRKEGEERGMRFCGAKRAFGVTRSRSGEAYAYEKEGKPYSRWRRKDVWVRHTRVEGRRHSRLGEAYAHRAEKTLGIGVSKTGNCGAAWLSWKRRFERKRGKRERGREGERERGREREAGREEERERGRGTGCLKGQECGDSWGPFC
eukprot:3317451-Rhodomonas_salina.1